MTTLKPYKPPNSHPEHPSNLVASAYNKITDLTVF